MYDPPEIWQYGARNALWNCLGCSAVFSHWRGMDKRRQDVSIGRSANMSAWRKRW